MRRRTYLGLVGSVPALGIAGCLGSGDGGGDNQAANEFGYPTEETDGVEVPLVPIEDAYEWHQDGILFADARSEAAYRKSHVAGAVFSPAPDGQPDDPVEAKPDSTRVVTYCGCPHHLSTMRAASLIEDGYANTYALDEGFRPWQQGDYPVEGEEAASIPDGFSIEGRTDPAQEGGRAWVRHDPTGQREVTSIEADGTFAMDVYFHEVGPETEVRLTTPAAEVIDSLRSLSSGVVDL